MLVGVVTLAADRLGAAGRRRSRADNNWEPFVSLDKDATHPAPVATLQKPGTGVWSVDVLTGAAPGAIAAASQRPVLASDGDDGDFDVRSWPFELVA